MAARRGALAAAARCLEQQLNEDQSDRTHPNSGCPLCHGPARYVERRAKTFTSVLGDLTLERDYFHCAPCGCGLCPRDRALGLADSTLSPALTRMVGAVGATVSFDEGHQLLKELAAVDLDAKTVERVAESLGAEIARDEKSPVQSGVPSAPTLYLGLDGTGIPMRRAELAGRCGKQPDGSSKAREVKLCSVWVPSNETRTASPSATTAPSPIRRQSRARPPQTASRPFPNSLSACSGKLIGEASRRPAG